jgi:hypothetical protein
MGWPEASLTTPRVSPDWAKMDMGSTVSNKNTSDHKAVMLPLQVTFFLIMFGLFGLIWRSKAENRS